MRQETRVVPQLLSKLGMSDDVGWRVIGENDVMMAPVVRETDSRGIILLREGRGDQQRRNS
jgi:hypothetical protein